jgi:hypothetical protein
MDAGERSGQSDGMNGLGGDATTVGVRRVGLGVTAVDAVPGDWKTATGELGETPTYGVEDAGARRQPPGKMASSTRRSR